MSIENFNKTNPSDKDENGPSEFINPEEQKSFEKLRQQFALEISEKVDKFVASDDLINQIGEEQLKDSHIFNEVEEELSITKALTDLNNQAEALKNNTSFKLGFSDEDFKLIENKYGLKISNDNIREEPRSLFQKLSYFIKDKLDNSIKYDPNELEALIEVIKKNKPETKMFYEGQNDNVEMAKIDWIDNMSKRKDIFGCEYGKLSEYLEKISLLKTSNGFHEYAKLLKESLGNNDFRIDYEEGMPSIYGGTKWISMNPYLLTAKEDSKNWMERLFYHFGKINGNELAFLQTMLHEATHAVMMKKINNPKTKEEIQARDSLYSIYCYVISKAPEYNADKFYGLTNLDEFCAEYYTAGSIRGLVKQIEENNTEANYVHKSDYPEKMSQPPVKQAFEKVKRLLIKRKPSELKYSAGNMSQQIEESVRTLIGTSLEYNLKDESIDGMIMNLAAHGLAKNKK